MVTHNSKSGDLPLIWSFKNEMFSYNFSQWLTTPPVFKLSSHVIRTMAIKQTVTKLLSDFKTNSQAQDVWHTKAIFSEEELSSIFSCLEGISDLQKANAVGFW